jgi:hypothetical protein
VLRAEGEQSLKIELDNMSIAKERIVVLDPWSIKVCQQLRDGNAISDIKGQFDNIKDIDQEEIDWVLSKGKQRYIGHYDFIKYANRDFAKLSIGTGFAMLAFGAVASIVVRWNTAVLVNGKMIACIVLGIGLIGYGLREWIFAEPEGRRKDLDKL